MSKITVNRGMKTQLAKELHTSRRVVCEALDATYKVETPLHVAIRNRANELVNEFYENVESRIRQDK